LRILVVDDHEDAAATLAELLRVMGHTVEFTVDALEALQLAPRFRPDIAFLDIGMPRMNGWDLCRALKHLMTVKCYAITGYATSSDQHKSREAGFDGHFNKPVDAATLSRIVEGS
jgi:CheY-like chemotaxis protein